jgi:4-hydroxybenzoate polyprenyltransferase
MDPPGVTLPGARPGAREETARRRAPPRRLAAIARFTRFSAVGGTVLLPVLGAAAVVPLPRPSLLAGLVAVAIAFHLFAYVVNDVVDLPVDRTEPRSAASPLVTGAMRPWQALAIAFAQVPAAIWLTARLGAGAVGQLALAAGLVLLAAYDVWGKRCPFPPLTDFVQGLGWAAMVVYGAVAAGEVTPLAWLLAGYVVVFIVFLNGVHGSLRDLANDHRHGVRTTAIVLGARPDPAGTPVVPSRLVAYAAALQAVLVAIVLPAAACCVPSRGPAWRAAGVVLALVLSALALGMLSMIGRLAAHRDAWRSAGMMHALVNLALPVALVAPSADWRLTAAFLALPLTPLLTHPWTPAALGWALRSAWRRLVAAGRRVADVVWLARLHNAAAAGAATLLGAYLAGADVARDGKAARAALTALLVVAAANALNDWHDVEEDRVNKPGRPLASGRLGRGAAVGVAVTLGLAGVGVALTLGPPPALAAACLSGLALAYCLWLKGRVLAGNATVGMLSASTLPFGALACGRPVATAAIGVAALLTFLFMTAYEILGAVSDREGDRLAGRRTIATRLGQGVALRAFRVLAVVSAIAVLLAWAGGAVGTRAAAALGATVPLPLIGIASALGPGASRRSVTAAHVVAKATWPLGLLAMVLLR